jgi:DNA-binding PadR family transcriptional regulator
MFPPHYARRSAAALAVALLCALYGPTPEPSAQAVEAPCEIRTTERVVAIGDVHGAHDQFVAILRSAGLIDRRDRWVGGRARLVQTGDILDRGSDSKKVIDLLRRLERDAAIESQAGDERGARRKKVYRITPKGEELFLELLEENPVDTQSEDARFRMRLAFFRYLPPETRIRLLERRRQALQRRLSAISESLRANRATDDYGTALIEHSRETIGSDITWLDGLIAAERRKSAAASGLSRRRAALRGKAGSSSEAVAQRNVGSSSEAVAQRKEKVS